MGKLLTGLGTRDVANNLIYWEKENRCSVSIRICSSRRQGSPDLMLTAAADETDPEDGVQRCLGSVSATCSAMNVVTLEAAVIQLLYRLDGQLANVELDNLTYDE